jgi:ATP-dependent DNA helicase RecG
VRRFIRLARARLPALLEDDPPARVLDNLRLTEGARLRRAAVLLFGDDPQALFPTAQVHVGRFGAGGTILDDRRIGGDLFTQLDEVVARLRSYLQVRLEVPGEPSGGGLADLQRREVWEYPLDALREALVNALIHRDYTALGDVQVRVSEDRLDIWNPGGLPAGLSSEDLRREGHVSRPRNPLLAQVFYYAGLVEGWGTGTTRMIAACRGQGLPEPEFHEEAGGLRVTFRTNPFAPDRLRAIGLNERQVQALADLHARGRQGELTNRQYQDLTGASRATASRDLEELIEHGLLRRIGRTGRGTRYVLGGGNVS